MGFARLTTELSRSRKITIENTFILEYMTVAPENYTKVYLMGLAMTSTDDNSLEGLALALNLDANIVLEAFGYWQAQGLINMTVEPPSVEFLPVIPYSRQIKKYSKEKYKSFNDQLHILIKERPITLNEYNEYYDLMESYHFEDTALLTVIGYCIRLKGCNVSYPYILTVAKNLAHENCTTYDRVQEKFSQMDLNDPDLRAVFKALGSKATPDHNDRRSLLKWKNEFGFNLETIIQVAKRVKKGGVSTLDMLLNRYYENRLFSIKEIDDFNTERESRYEMTRNILKILGLRYDLLDHIIETYISAWLAMGFKADVLYILADYCFKRNIKDLEGMNKTIYMFYKQGLISLESIESFLKESLAVDEQIKALFAKMDITRLVTSRDRDFYRTWTESWKISPPLLDLAASLSRDKTNPAGYMNSILSSWKEQNIDTVEKAKAASTFKPSAAADQTVKPQEGNKNFVSRNLTSEELNAMFDRLENEEL